MKRRKFLKIAAGVLAAPAAGIGYGFWEAAAVGVVRKTVAVPNLPPAFVGKKLALLTDIHHGKLNSLPFVRSVVRMANDLQPDLIALAGDFVEGGSKYQRPCLQALADLKAPLGVFAVPGNHDMSAGGTKIRAAIRDAGLTDVTNGGQWVECAGQRIRVAGVDDLWHGQPDLDAALAGTAPRDAVVLLCHNPDFVESIDDARVGLVLSGHMHNGQIRLPLLGSPWLPSRFGSKYRHGLVRGPATQVYVSGGIGCVGLPIRFGCRPEINLLTLESSVQL